MALLNKKKFILTIGDDGAVLALVDGVRLVKRFFAASASVSERREINTLFNSFPEVPVYVMLDIMEQTYTKQTLPAVSSLAIGKLVSKRLDRDFTETDLKGALLLGRTETGRKDWMYMFASCPLTSGLNEWMNYIISLKNKFAGVYMLPVEAQSLVNKLEKVLEKDKNDKVGWKFIVIHNKTGGFRQVVLHNGKVIFTRLIRSGADELPDILAGNIEQEISNTIEYLRRLSFGENEKINIIILVSQDIKQSLKSSKIVCNKLTLITPFEASNQFKFTNVANVEDKFGDLFFAVNFANSKPVLALHNPNIQRIQSLSSARTFAKAAALTIIPMFIIYLAYGVYSIFDTKSQIKAVENEKISAQKKWSDARKTDDYDINEATKITDAIVMHNTLTKLERSPVETIDKLHRAIKGRAIVQSLNWKYSNDISKKDSKDIISAVFNMDFSNTGGNLEELFSNFDVFIKRIRKNFSGYHLENSKLPDKITFKEKNKVINIQVTVTSVDEENDKKPKRR